jgi:hypothetical protein
MRKEGLDAAGVNLQAQKVRAHTTCTTLPPQNITHHSLMADQTPLNITEKHRQ